jgi:hypothetical protein
MADTKISDLPAASLPLDGTGLVPIVQGGTSKKVTVADLRESYPTVVLTSTVTNTTTTAAVGVTRTGLVAGTYNIKAWVAWSTAATTTGIQMYLNYTGTNSRLVSTWYTLTTGGAAATGVADQATTTTAQMLEGKAQRANNTASGAIQGTDTANADQFSVIEGILVATGAGDLSVMFNSEVASSAANLLPGTNLDVRRVA